MMHCSLCRLAIFDHFHISYYTGAWMTPPALSLDMQPCCDNSTGPIGLVVWWSSFAALYIPVGVIYAYMLR